MTKKTASGAAAKKYDSTNCLGATVFDVDGDVFLKCVKSIDILAREVELFYEPYRVHNPTYTIKFRRIESIVGDAEAPMRFNCYARSGAGGQVAQASSGAGPSGAGPSGFVGVVAEGPSGAGGQVAQASSGAGGSGPDGVVADKTAQAIEALHQVIKTLEAGRDVVSMEVRTYLGEPRLHSINGPTFSSCIGITIETNPRAKP